MKEREAAAAAAASSAEKALMLTGIKRCEEGSKVGSKDVKRL